MHCPIFCLFCLFCLSCLFCLFLSFLSCLCLSGRQKRQKNCLSCLFCLFLSFLSCLCLSGRQKRQKRQKDKLKDKCKTRKDKRRWERKMFSLCRGPTDILHAAPYLWLVVILCGPSNRMLFSLESPWSCHHDRPHFQQFEQLFFITCFFYMIPCKVMVLLFQQERWLVQKWVNGGSPEFGSRPLSLPKKVGCGALMSRRVQRRVTRDQQAVAAISESGGTRYSEYLLVRLLPCPVEYLVPGTVPGTPVHGTGTVPRSTRSRLHRWMPCFLSFLSLEYSILVEWL